MESGFPESSLGREVNDMRNLQEILQKNRIPVRGILILSVLGIALAAAVHEAGAAERPFGAAERPFGAGERLVFDVYYGPLKAGQARMEVGPVESIRGRDCLRLVSTARSNSVVSAFFRVDDRVESWIDVEHLLPLRFEKHLREGRYECDRVVDYYHERGVALAEGSTIEIGDQTLDALSSMYWVRTLDLFPGAVLWLSSTSSQSTYDLRVNVTGRETLKTPAGEFDCLVVEPHLSKDGGIFDQHGRMWIWLTDDAFHLPIQMVSKVAIGSIKAVLADHTLGEIVSAGDAGRSGQNESWGF